jgi:hypothetical protein
VNGDSIDYDSGINVFGKALNREGNVVDIGFDLDIVVSAGWEWEEDESPTGWNYSRDEPTYTSSTYASVGTPEVSSVSFSPEQDFYIDNETYSIRDAQQIIDPNVLRQLLNPAIYSKLMSPAFEKQGENIEQPEPDFNEPDRDEY